jgi:DNA-binding GntR family transcriptional regulator
MAIAKKRGSRAGLLKSKLHRGPALRGRTRSTEIWERLRSDIVETRLQPGTKLQFDQMRQVYDVGLSPLREALFRLSATGLVVLKDQRGFSVAPVSTADLLDVTRLRLELEPWALRMSIEKGTEEWEAEVLAATHRLSKEQKRLSHVRPELNDAWEVHHRAFHRILVSACDSPWLLKVRDQLYDHTDRYRRLHVRYAPARDDVAEHRALMEAAVTHNVDAATQLLRQHISATADELLANDKIFTSA